MVKSLHAAGIEVIIDVVYNHTAEGNHLGPTLSMKGIDNQAYYRLVDATPEYYLDFTGTGNSLNMRHPHVLQLIMDSLRYWVLEMHVDGFRFDLASTLARELYEVDRLSAFFDLVHQDPVVSQVKLIAEPWDVGEGGYQVGNFPPQWSEWTGRYRDTIRDFWRGEPSTLAEFGYRFTGSSDLYEADTRRPTASINFVTAHDGFTLRDLVSYNEKHNEANQEDGRDGESHNRSWNHGAEGPTDDPEVRALRARQRRNLVTTLLLSQGVPMLSGGDELGRTQDGNNNAYCQDNELSWYPWGDVDDEFVAWCQRVIAFRAAHPAFRRRQWFQGRLIRGIEDLAWTRPDGEEMTDEDWETGFARAVGVFINGRTIPTPDAYGEKIVDDTFLVIFNASDQDLSWTIPAASWGRRWVVDLDTADPRRGLGRAIVGRGERESGRSSRASGTGPDACCGGAERLLEGRAGAGRALAGRRMAGHGSGRARGSRERRAPIRDAPPGPAWAPCNARIAALPARIATAQPSTCTKSPPLSSARARRLPSSVPPMRTAWNSTRASSL
jgi:glycogen operon protein